MVDKVAGVRLAEVAVTLRDLEPGLYPVRDLYEQYIEACRMAGYAGGRPQPFGRALSMLGAGLAEYSSKLGGKARFINPAGMARRWPNLPWRS